MGAALSQPDVYYRQLNDYYQDLVYISRKIPSVEALEISGIRLRYLESPLMIQIGERIKQLKGVVRQLDLQYRIQEVGHPTSKQLFREFLQYHDLTVKNYTTSLSYLDGYRDGMNAIRFT